MSPASSHLEAGACCEELIISMVIYSLINCEGRFWKNRISIAFMIFSLQPMQDALDPTHLFKEIKQSIDDSIFHMFHSEQ